MRGYADGPEFDLLFWKARGSDVRGLRIRSAVQKVDHISDEILSTELAGRMAREIIADHSVVVPTLQRADIEFERRDRSVRRSDAFGRMFEGKIPTYYFEVPFVGDAEIFGLQPDTYDTSPPRGQVKGNILVISVTGPTDPSQIKNEAEATIASVERYLGWHGKLWSGYEEELASQVNGQLNRRIQLAKQANATNSGLEDLGFRPKR